MIERVRTWLFPLMATRAERRLNVAMVATGAMLLAGVLGILISQGKTRLWFVYPLLAFGFAHALCRFLLRRAHYRARRRLQEWAYLVCPECCYALARSLSQGRCPECGRPFDQTELRRVWSHRYTALIDRVEREDSYE